MPPCTCRPCDRWCRVARRLRAQMKIAHDMFRAYRVSDPQRAVQALKAFDLAEKMLRGHLAAVGTRKAA